eukprot:jgi/Astpho2/8185/Aster-x0804
MPHLTSRVPNVAASVLSPGVMLQTDTLLPLVQMMEPHKKKWSDTEAVQWCLQLAKAVAYLHSRSPLVIHRDLKLENVLLRCTAGVCLLNPVSTARNGQCYDSTRSSLGDSRKVKDTSNQLSRALTHMRSQGSEITNMRTIMADMTAQPLAPEELAGGQQQGRVMALHPSWPLNRRGDRQQGGPLHSGDSSARGHKRCAPARQPELPHKSPCSRMLVSSLLQAEGS